MFADAIVGSVDFAVEGEQQGDGMFGDCVGGVGGDARELDSEVAGGCEVYVVEAGAAKRDMSDAEVVEGCEAVAIEAVIDKAAHGLGALGASGGVGGETEVVENPLEFLGALGGGHVVAVVGFGIVESDGLHGLKCASVFSEHPSTLRFVTIPAVCALGG